MGASLAAFALSASMFSMFLYLALYLQNVLGYSALEAGLRFLPVTIVAFMVAPISGKLAERLGVRWFLAGGLVCVGVGMLLMSGVDAGDEWTALLVGFLVAGLGVGLVNPALATAAIGVVDARRAGMASGINSTFRQVGIATGIAAWGAVFQHHVESSFRAAAEGQIPRGVRWLDRGLRQLRRLPAAREPRAQPHRRAGVRRRPQRHPALRRPWSPSSAPSRPPCSRGPATSYAHGTEPAAAEPVAA